MSDQQMTPFAAFKGAIEKQRAGFESVLPKSVDVDRFIRTTLTAVQINGDLLTADRKSLMISCMKAAQDGLLPDGREAVFNIYSTKQKVPHNGRMIEEWVPTVQYLPMVRGLVKLIRNSPEVADIDAAAVFNKDAFHFQRGDDPRITHEPYGGMDEPGDVIAAYCIVTFRDGRKHREVMWRRDIEKARAASKNANGASSPWVKWYDQMAIKSVIHRAAKLVPGSAEALERALEHDNDAMGYTSFRNDRDQDETPPALPADTAPPAENAAPALPDERPQQDARRPSRMAGIMNRAKQAEPASKHSDADPPPPWENAA